MNINSHIINIPSDRSKSKNNIIKYVKLVDRIEDDTIIGGYQYKKNNNSKLLTKTNESECSNGGNICSYKKIIQLASKYINYNGDNDVEIINVAKSKLKCDSESCILSDPDFNKYVINNGGKELIEKNWIQNFKPSGPRNNTNLLSNFNIDETLMMWAREFKDFYPCPFSMIDFKYIGNEFGTINLADVFSGKQSYEDPIIGINTGPFKTFGCVLNTDVSTGRGKHWVCIFVDCRLNTWTIEYFNSSGNPPNYDVNEWMEKQRKNLLTLHDKVETIAVTNIVHQKSNTECGMYVLYYIRSRLDETPYKLFLTKRIDDSDVTNFRKHVFRKN